MVAGTEQKASELSDLITTVARAVLGEGMGAECSGVGRWYDIKL